MSFEPNSFELVSFELDVRRSVELTLLLTVEPGAVAAIAPANAPVTATLIPAASTRPRRLSFRAAMPLILGAPR
jgi:hypothetical protein